MAKLSLKAGTTSYLVEMFIRDSSQTDGRGLAGLVFNSGSLTAYYARADQGDNDATAISLVTATRGTWTSGGFKEKDATHMPGVYEFGIPDAALASGAPSVVIMLKGASNMAPCLLEIQLDPVTLSDLGAYIDTEIASILAAVDTEVAAIKAKTDNLPSDPADESSIQSAIASLASAVGVIDDFLDTEIAAIKAKTDALPSDPADESILEGLINAVKAKTDNLPADPADESNTQDGLVAIAAAVTTIASGVAAVKAKTDNLPSDPADQSAVEAAIAAATSPLATASALSTAQGDITTIKNVVDTEVAAIKAKTDALPSDPADQSQVEAAITSAVAGLATAAALATAQSGITAIQAKTDALPSDPADESSTQAGLATIAGLVTAVGSAVANVQAKTDNLPADPASQADVETAISAAQAAIIAHGDEEWVDSGGGGGGDCPTVEEIAVGVVDQVLAGHTTPGTVGGALNSAGSAGDPFASTDYDDEDTYPDGTFGHEFNDLVGAVAGIQGTLLELQASGGGSAGDAATASGLKRVESDGQVAEQFDLKDQLEKAKHEEQKDAQMGFKKIINPGATGC